MNNTNNKVKIFVRFDDVYQYTKELENLIMTFLNLKMSLNLGVTPLKLDPKLIRSLNLLCRKYPGQVEIDQHGYRHERLKKGELDGYDDRELKTNLAAGFKIMERNFKSNFSRILTVPWHAHSENLLSVAQEIGFKAVSVNNRTDNIAKLFYTLGRSAGKSTLYGYHVSYHSKQQDKRLTEISPSLDTMSAYRDGGVYVDKVRLKKKFQKLLNRKESIGILIHPQFYTNKKRLSELRLFLKEIKKNKYIQYVLMTNLLTEGKMITPRDQEQYYNNNSYYFSHLRKSHWEGYFDSILRMFHKIPEEYRNKAQILDVGSGSGNLINILVTKEKCPETNIYGLDVSSIGLRMHQYGTRIRGNAKKLPFKENSFDICISSDTVEHILDYTLSLKEMYRITKPGGFIIIRTQNYDCPVLNFDGNDLKIYKRIKADRDAVSRTSAREIYETFSTYSGKMLYFESWASFNWKIPALRIFNYLPYLRFRGGTCSLLFQKSFYKNKKTIIQSDINLVCPNCLNSLNTEKKRLVCRSCKNQYKIQDGYKDLYISV